MCWRDTLKHLGITTAKACFYRKITFQFTGQELQDCLLANLDFYDLDTAPSPLPRAPLSDCLDELLINCLNIDTNLSPTKDINLYNNCEANITASGLTTAKSCFESIYLMPCGNIFKRCLCDSTKYCNELSAPCPPPAAPPDLLHCIAVFMPACVDTLLTLLKGGTETL